MSKKEKIIARFRTIPKDFTMEELTNLLGFLGFVPGNKGRTSGSRTEFVKDQLRIQFHKPHPGNTVPVYVIKQILEYLERNNLI